MLKRSEKASALTWVEEDNNKTVIEDAFAGFDKADVGLGNADNTSDASKPVSTAQAAADTVVLNSAKAYADGLVVGLWDDRGNYNASGNAFPSSGGSGMAGAILKGDIWTVSVAGTLGGQAVAAGDTVRALVDTPGQTAGNWAIAETNIGYVPENVANKGQASGYVGLSAARAVQMPNALGTFVSILGNANTAPRTYGTQDRDGTLLDDTDLATLTGLINALTEKVNPDFVTITANSAEPVGKTDILLDCTGGNVQLTLLENVTAGPSILRVKRIDNTGNTCTVRAGGSDLFDTGSNTVTLAAQYDWVHISRNGSGTTIIAYEKA